MPTSRETILAAMHARLSSLPATALRGEVLPERVPTEGLLVLRDGEPGEPEVTLSPLRDHYQHRAEIEAVVQDSARDAAVDTLIASIGAALAAGRTRGGLYYWVEAEAPRPQEQVLRHSPKTQKSELAAFIERRILELKPIRTQSDIAEATGFVNANMLSMIKSGKTKLALDRVPALAAALDVDPAHLFLLAFDQDGNDTARRALEEIFGTMVTRNEARWIEEIRDASGGSDPAVTNRTRASIRAIFGR